MPPSSQTHRRNEPGERLAATGRPDRDTALRASAAQNVRALVGVMGRSARAIETSVGITNAQLFILEQLASEGPLTIGQLGRRLQVRANTVSMAVTKLAERGLLTRRHSPDDRRRVAVGITASGRRLLRRAPAPPAARLAAALHGMPRHELDHLVRGLQALAQAMTGAVPRLAAAVARVRSAGIVVGLLGAGVAPLVA